MKAVIFCGGVGTRMWPVSRTNTPKQFEPLVSGKSTVELFYAQMEKYFGVENIFIATNKLYKTLLKRKLPKVPERNILLEPAQRDLGPSVGHAAAVINQIAPDEPLAILWSDDLFKNIQQFYKAFDLSREYLKKDPNKYLYIGQKPLFPDQNKGWIHYGKVVEHINGTTLNKYIDFHYRPPLEITNKFFRGGKHAVNTGDFVTTPRHVMNLYKKFAPKMYKQLQKIASTYRTKDYVNTLEDVYPKLEKISHDDLIAVQTDSKDALVVLGDFGWYGFGDWDAIKEALQSSPQDVIKQGKVVDRNSRNSLVYNYTDKLVSTIDLEDMLVINTKDALLVCPKTSVPEIKKMLKDFKGTEYEKYT